MGDSKSQSKEELEPSQTEGQEKNKQKEISCDSHQPTNKSQGSSRLSQRPPIETDSSEEQWRADQRRHWKRQLTAQWCLNWITLGAAVVGIGTLPFLYGTLKTTQISADAAKTQADAAIQALHSQRPFVSFGKPDGRLLDYIKPRKSDKKGSIILYFRNTGPAPAQNLLINAYSSLPPIEKGGNRHLYRFRIYFKGQPAGISFMGGTSLGASSVHSQPLEEKWVPNPEQWSLIRSGQWNGTFRIEGTFEYCDSWGQYRCETFAARYQPPPIDNFIATQALPQCFVHTPDPSEMAKGEDYRAEPLPTCEQPEERSLQMQKQNQ